MSSIGAKAASDEAATYAKFEVNTHFLVNNEQRFGMTCGYNCGCQAAWGLGSFVVPKSGLHNDRTIESPPIPREMVS